MKRRINILSRVVAVKGVNRVALVPVMFRDNGEVKHINPGRVVEEEKLLFYDDRGTQERWDARKKRMALKRLVNQSGQAQEEEETTPSTSERRKM